MNGLIVLFYVAVAMGFLAVICIFVLVCVCLVKEIITDAVEAKQFYDKNRGA